MRKDIYKVEIYSIKTIAPVHIGTGIKLGDWDFLEENGKLYVISLDKLLENLTPTQQEKIAEYMENRKSLKEFLRNENIKINVSDISLYKMHLIDNSSRVRNVWEEIKHPEGLYIPASTIKGAIRTAILYCLLKENKNNYIFSIENGNILLKDKNRNLLAKGLSEKDRNSVQNFLEREFFGENQSNDIFKYLKISDSKINEKFDRLVCRKIYVANTTQFSNGRIRKHPEYYEIIEEETSFYDIKVSIPNKILYKDFINPKYIKTLEKIENWKQCLCEFSKDLLEAEISFWENENVEQMIKQAYQNSPHRYLLDTFDRKAVINQLKKIKEENSSESPVIRLGKLTGYFTHSIGLLLAKNKEKPYNIKEYGKLFFRNRAKDWLFPLTRRLTLDNQTLGWCKLEVQKGKPKNSHQINSKENQKPTIENLASMWGAKVRK